MTERSSNGIATRSAFVEAAALCPVSRLFGGAEITMSSHLLEE